MATHPHIYLGSRRRWHCITIFIQEEIVIYLATHLNGIWEQMATNFNTCPIGDGHWILEGENLRQYSHRSNDNPFQFVCRRGRPLNPRRKPISTWEEMPTHFHIYMGRDDHSFQHLSRRRWSLIPISI